MQPDVIITKEVFPLPGRLEDAHKADVGRVMVIGGCHDIDITMVGALALAANAALRSGAGLVQCAVPSELRIAMGVLSPCATHRSLPETASKLIAVVEQFGANVLRSAPDWAVRSTRTNLASSWRIVKSLWWWTLML